MLAVSLTTKHIYIGKNKYCQVFFCDVWTKKRDGIPACLRDRLQVKAAFHTWSYPFCHVVMHFLYITDAWKPFLWGIIFYFLPIPKGNKKNTDLLK